MLTNGTGGKRKPWPIWGPYCSIWMEKLRETTWMFSKGSWCLLSMSNLLLNNLLGTLPLESESQTCMFWGVHTVKHTIYGCRIHSHAFIQPSFYEVSELVSWNDNSFKYPRKTPNILTSTLKMDGGCLLEHNAKIQKIQHDFYNRYTL